MFQLTFRPAREDDLDRLIDIHSMAFPDARGEEPRRRNFMANPLGRLQDLQVALAGDVIVGHGFLFPLELWYAGRPVRCGGIASIGIAPEARGHGVGAALVHHLHELADARQDAITLLYGFRQGFYQRLGYTPWPPFKRLTFTPRAVPKEMANELGREGWTWTAARGDDRDAIVHLHEKVVRVQSGQFRRPLALWEHRWSDPRQHAFVLRRQGQVRGYLSFALHMPEVHGKTTLHVTDWWSDGMDAQRAGLAFLGSMRDQVHEVEVDLALTSPLDRLLVDADAARFGTELAEHTVGTLQGAPLIRMVQVERALSSRGYPRDGGCELFVKNTSNAYRLLVRDGEAKIHRVPSQDGTLSGLPRLTVSWETLGALAFGGLSVTDAMALGWASVDGASVADMADFWGHECPFSRDAF